MTADRRIALGLFVLAFVAYGWFCSGGGWNQNAHFDLTRAVVERGSVAIDGYHTNTGDISRVGGHVYINKPPGVSFLAAVPYALVRTLFGTSDWTFTLWLVTLLTCGVCGALVPVVLYLYGVRHVSRGAALAVALTIAFATIVFPYSTLLMAHVPPALFLLLAFVWRDERPLLAGMAAGMAGMSYYLCIVAALVLLAGAWRGGGLRPALRFAAGGAPFGIALALYHYVCFGSPFVTALEVSRTFTESGLLLGVFRLPSLQALWGLTFSEYRGLFFISPVLLLAFAGARVMARTLRRELVLIAVIVGVFVFAVSSFNGWSGGSAIGPRYLVPVIPLLGVPLLFVQGRLSALLAALSFALVFLATAVDPTPLDTIRRPFRDYLIPAFVSGGMQTSLNQQSVDEEYAHQRHPRGSPEALWASFNFGELMFGAGSRASVLPIALWIVLGSALLAYMSSRA